MRAVWFPSSSITTMMAGSIFTLATISEDDIIQTFFGAMMDRADQTAGSLPMYQLRLGPVWRCQRWASASAITIGRGSSISLLPMCWITFFFRNNPMALSCKDREMGWEKLTWRARESLILAATYL